MIDVILILMVAGVTWVVASDGAWGAGLTLVCVIFSGLLAMNFFEPVANWMSSSFSGFSAYADLVSLCGIFAILTFASRMATEYVAPTQIEIDGRLYQPVRWLCAAASGYVAMAFLLTALHTAPLPREFIGFKPERRNLFNAVAPDRQWLGFTQRVSEKILGSGRVFDGPKFPAPGTPQDIWPMFPIRYATKREAMVKGGGAGASTSAAPGLVVPGSSGGGARGTPQTSF